MVQHDNTQCKVVWNACFSDLVEVVPLIFHIGWLNSRPDFTLKMEANVRGLKLVAVNFVVVNHC